VVFSSHGGKASQREGTRATALSSSAWFLTTSSTTPQRPVGGAPIRDVIVTDMIFKNMLLNSVRATCAVAAPAATPAATRRSYKDPMPVAPPLGNRDRDGAESEVDDGGDAESALRACHPQHRSATASSASQSRLSQGRLSASSLSAGRQSVSSGRSDLGSTDAFYGELAGGGPFLQTLQHVSVSSTFGQKRPTHHL
jgi:hypothetical protein